MTERTTDEWKALLDGWVCDKQPDTLLGSWVRSTQIRKQEQAAPEAVAETVRLRRELEELRDDLGKAEYSSGPDPDDHALGEMQEASRIVRRITRILEGEA